jgi:hypothetical protein
LDGDIAGITNDVAAYFGIISTKPDLMEVYTQNKVFRPEDFIRLVDALHEAQAAGNGLIATLKLNTICNSHWNVDADIECEVTWVYLGRVKAWEDQVPDFENFARIYNPDEWSYHYDQQFHFPNFPTRFGSLNHQQANALSNLTGWTILHNRTLFEGIFSNSRRPDDGLLAENQGTEQDQARENA